MEKISRLFVAGGAGYVGSRLIPELIKKGYEVTVYDLYLYGSDVFRELKDNPKLTEVKADVRDLKAVDQALAGCDAVIHLACILAPALAICPRNHPCFVA